MGRSSRVPPCTSRASVAALFALREALQRLRKGWPLDAFAARIEEIHRILALGCGRDPHDHSARGPISFPPEYLDALPGIIEELDRLLPVSPKCAHRIVRELRETTRLADAVGKARCLLFEALDGAGGPDPMCDRPGFSVLNDLKKALERAGPELSLEIEKVYIKLAAMLGRDPEDPAASVDRPFEQDLIDLVWELHLLAQVFPDAPQRVLAELREKASVVHGAAGALRLLGTYAPLEWPWRPGDSEKD